MVVIHTGIFLAVAAMPLLRSQNMIQDAIALLHQLVLCVISLLIANQSIPCDDREFDCECDLKLEKSEENF